MTPPLFLLLLLLVVHCYFLFSFFWTACQCIWINVSLYGASGSSNNNRWQTCLPLPSWASSGKSTSPTCFCMQLIHYYIHPITGKSYVPPTPFLLLYSQKKATGYSHGTLPCWWKSAHYFLFWREMFVLVGTEGFVAHKGKQWLGWLGLCYRQSLLMMAGGDISQNSH